MRIGRKGEPSCLIQLIAEESVTVKDADEVVRQADVRETGNKRTRPLSQRVRVQDGAEGSEK